VIDTNNTNVVVTGAGTPSDPYIYNIHTSPQSGTVGGIGIGIVGLFFIGLCIGLIIFWIFHKRKT
jgi:hypothetical protein